MKAIIEINSKQYVVRVGDQIAIDLQKTDQVSVQVLMIIDGEKSEIGQPYLENYQAESKIIDPLAKGHKIEVIKFKPKKGYLKHTGHRQKYSIIEITKIAKKK